MMGMTMIRVYDDDVNGMMNTVLMIMAVILMMVVQVGAATVVSHELQHYPWRRPGSHGGRHCQTSQHWLVG